MRIAEGAPTLAPWAAAETLGLTAAELAAFQDEPPQMASGAVGKTGFLRLGFEARGNRTILADLDRRAPYNAADRKAQVKSILSCSMPINIHPGRHLAASRHGQNAVPVARQRQRRGQRSAACRWRHGA